MHLFDLHCDTLYRATDENSGLFNDSFHISFNKSKNISPYIQCLAVWLPDEIRGEAALEHFNACFDKLHEQLDNTDILICKGAEDIEAVCSAKKTGVVLTVEGGGVLGGKLKNIDYLAECGVKMMTLTWNGRCEIGDGIGVENPTGITDFGKKAVKQMEERRIIVDISHASEKLFYDVAQIASKPFCASHSNSRSVCSHKRNLTDEQFKIIVQKGGLVGLNLSRGFLNDDESSASAYDVLRHADYFLSLGGENTVAMGTDFDGTDIPEDMTGIESMEYLYELFLKHGYSQTVTDKIFFENAKNFFKNYLIY